MKVAGVVLCGGQSSRMGSPKALLRLGEETFLERTVRIVHAVVQPVLVVASSEQELPPLVLDDVAILRETKDHEGPLAGFLTGLTHMTDAVDAVYLSSCDMPLLKPEFVRRMTESLGDFDIVIPKTGGRFHPLAAVYHKRVIVRAIPLYADGHRRMTTLLDNHRVRVLEESDFADIDPGLDSLRNVNTPEEYAAVLARFQ